MRNAATLPRECLHSLSLARARSANVIDGGVGVDAMDARPRAFGTRREDPTDGLGDDDARRR